MSLTDEQNTSADSDNRQRFSENNTNNELIRYDNYIKAVVRGTIKCMRLPLTMEEDLISAGYIGLLEASGRYDVNADSDFKTYAFLRVRGSIIDTVRRSGCLNRTGYKICKLLESAEEARSSIPDRQVAYCDITNRSTTEREQKKLVHSLEYLSHFVKLYKKLSDDKSSNIKEIDPCTPEQLLLTEEKKDRVKKIIQKLPDSERYVIEQYYYKDRQFSEIAKDNNGHSKSWVSKSHTSALRRLRKICLNEGI